MAKLLVVSGPPCSGKSSLAAALSKELRFHWIEVDRVLSSLIPKSDRRKSHRDIAHRAAFLIAEKLLSLSRPVILDATYRTFAQRKSVETCALKAGAQLYLIQCQVSPQEAVDRYRRRSNHPAIDLNPARIRRLADRYPYSRNGLVLPAKSFPVESVRLAKRYVQLSRPVPVDGRWSRAARARKSPHRRIDS